jgi:hypothetical protein
MSEHARVRDGKLAVGSCSYRIVIVPPSLTWEASTAGLLADFAAAGGTVIAIEPVPVRVAGQPASSVLPEGTMVVADVAAAVRAADEVCPAEVMLGGAPDVLCHHRRCGTEDVVFLVNISRTQSFRDVEVTFRGRGQGGGLERWDPLTGERAAVTWTPGGPLSALRPCAWPPIGRRGRIRTWSCPNTPALPAPFLCSNSGGRSHTLRPASEVLVTFGEYPPHRLVTHRLPAAATPGSINRAGTRRRLSAARSRRGRR